MNISVENLADDLLEGAAAISQFIYGTPSKRRRVYFLAEANQLPCFKLGSVLCARKSTLKDHIAKLERAA